MFCRLDFTGKSRLYFIVLRVFNISTDNADGKVCEALHEMMLLVAIAGYLSGAPR